MSLETIKSAVTSRAARQLLFTQRHSPRILFVAGSVGVVAATVMACRATLKLEDVLAGHEIREDVNNKLRDNTDHVDSEEHVKFSARNKVQTGLEIAKLYAPAVALGAASIGALTGSHAILTKRNGTLMAAYAGLDRAYREYRERVRQQYGRDVDYKFASGSENVSVEEKLADGTTKSTIKTAKDPNGLYHGSPYAVVFDEKSRKFSTEPGRNAMTIQMNQSFANDKLRAQGHLFLNEVYEMLGLPRTSAGQIVGWVWRRENETKNGDNYVDFGVFNDISDADYVQAFIDGEENNIWLDFNVDGPIYQLLDEEKNR